MAHVSTSNFSKDGIWMNMMEYHIGEWSSVHEFHRGLQIQPLQWFPLWDGNGWNTTTNLNKAMLNPCWWIPPMKSPVYVWLNHVKIILNPMGFLLFLNVPRTCRTCLMCLRTCRASCRSHPQGPELLCGFDGETTKNWRKMVDINKNLDFRWFEY